MTREEVTDIIGYDDVIEFEEGLDSAIIGVASRFGMSSIVCYDANKTDKGFSMTPMSPKEVIDLVGDESTLYEGLESAIIGITKINGKTVVCYDYDKTIKALGDGFSVTEDDLDDDEKADGITIEDKKVEMAIDWYYYNTIGGWVGDTTPVFITTQIE